MIQNVKWKGNFNFKRRMMEIAHAVMRYALTRKTQHVNGVNN